MNEPLLRHLTLEVKGMTCASCANFLENHLKNSEVSSIISCRVSFLASRVKLELNNDDVDQIVQEIEIAGFSVESYKYSNANEPETTILLQLTEEVDEKTNSSLLHSLKLVLNPFEVKVEKRGNSVFALQYRTHLISARQVLNLTKQNFPNLEFLPTSQFKTRDRGRENLNFSKKLLRDILIATVAVLLLHLSSSAFLDFLAGSWIYFVSAFRFHSKFIQNARNFKFSMATLISCGTTVAYSFAVFQLLLDERHYDFATPAMLIYVQLLGLFVETKARQMTLTENVINEETDCKLENRLIHPELLGIGDMVLFGVGDFVPCDGVVDKSQNLTVDESVLTGEFDPKRKDENDEIFSGSTILTGFLRLRITKVGRNSTINEIRSQIEDVRERKTHLQDVADRVVSKFSLILVLAFFVLVYWSVKVFLYEFREDLTNPQKIRFVLEFVVATLMIPCPCALGLAAPTGIFVATSVAVNKLRCLPKNLESLELARLAQFVALDKTGTLTCAELTVVEKHVEEAHDFRDDELWRLIMFAERNSQHPTAEAIKRHLGSHDFLLNFEVCEVVDKPSQGVSLKFVKEEKQLELRIGTELFCEKIPLELIKAAESRQNKFGSLVYFRIDKTCGYFLLQDNLRESAPEAVRELRKRKIEPVILTGDSFHATEKVAETLGIPYFASLNPTEKAEKVREIQKQGVCIFVGDGVNDSVALTQADVGFAFFRDNALKHITLKTADVVVMSKDLEDVVRYVDLSKKLVQTLYVNFVWAFIFNVAGLPLAMGLFYPIKVSPLASSTAMAASSILVILSSLSLKLRV